ncbi:hypothetical protein F4804DRAFT_318207, partial [Jackrogersella minutella]
GAFLQDYEYKLSLAGGIDWPASIKIGYLDEALNEKLRNQLISKTLLEDKYDEWAKKVSRVAARLEATAGYRRSDGRNTTTWYEGGTKNKAAPTQRGGDDPESRPQVDSSEDTIMGGINFRKSVGIIPYPCKIRTIRYYSRSRINPTPAWFWEKR